MSLPLKKSNDLVDKINALLHSETKSEFEFKQIEYEAKKLMLTDAASAHLVLGMLSSLKHNRDNLVKHHELALSLGVDRFSGHRNYSVSLSNIGCLSAGLEHARKAYRIEKNPDIIRALIALNFKSGRFEEAFKYLHELGGLNIEPPKEFPSSKELEELTMFMEKNAIRDDDLAKITGIAEEIVLKNKLEANSYTFCIFNENGDDWLSVEISISAIPKMIASLNISLAESLVESESVDFLLDKVSCRFIPHQEKMKTTVCL